jgi:hypothetical protein
MEIITKTKDNLGFERNLFQEVKYTPQKTEKKFKNWKDELVTEFTNGINQSRIGTPYKPIKEKLVALRINSHPIYRDDQSECYQLLKVCKQKHFGIFFKATKLE